MSSPFLQTVLVAGLLGSSTQAGTSEIPTMCSMGGFVREHYNVELDSNPIHPMGDFPVGMFIGYRILNSSLEDSPTSDNFLVSYPDAMNSVTSDGNGTLYLTSMPYRGQSGVRYTLKSTSDGVTVYERQPGLFERDREALQFAIVGAMEDRDCFRDS